MEINGINISNSYNSSGELVGSSNETYTGTLSGITELGHTGTISLNINYQSQFEKYFREGYDNSALYVMAILLVSSLLIYFMFKEFFKNFKF